MAHPDSTTVNDSFAARLALVYAGFFLASGWQLPLFPVWLSARGLDPAAIGLALAAYQAIRIVATPAGTRLADRHGSLDAAIMASAIATVGALALLGAVSGFPLILAATMLFGFASAPLMPLIDAYALKGLRLRARSYGPVRLWGSVAFIVANLTGGWLLTVLAKPHLIWLILAGNCAVALLAAMLIRIPPEARPPQSTGHSHLRQPRFLAIAAASSLTQASHAVYYGFATLDWTAKGYGGTMIGVLWALGVVAEIVLFALSARLPPSIGPASLILIGAAGAALRWVATAFDPPLVLLAPLQLLHALSFGATHLGTMMYLTRSAPEGGRAAAQGDIATANTLVMAAATAFAGVLYGIGPGHAYAAMAMLAAAGATMALVYPRLAARKAAPDRAISDDNLRLPK
jgi:MFS transporter, PPP family, 3-phenylpropionic acid transporter